MTQRSLVPPLAPNPFLQDLPVLFDIAHVDLQPTVLIVDANTLFRQTIKGVLEDVGYTVLLASRSEDGLRLAVQRKPDACIVDYALQDGTRFVQRLRREPVLQRMAVLMLSGTDDLEDEGRAFDAGADDFIIKSDGFQVLRHRLRAHLRRRAAEEDLRRTQATMHRRELDVREAQAAREVEEVRQSLLAVIERQGAEIHKLHAQIARQGEDAGQRLTDLSGELRRPLNDIIGFSELLDREVFGPLTERQRDYLKKIKGGGRHLLGVADELLDLTRIEAGRMELAPAPTCLGLLVEAVAGIVRPMAAERDVTLVVHVEGNPRVLADRTRLRQGLHKLIGQTVAQTMDGGRVDIRVSTRDLRAEVRLTAIPAVTPEPGEEHAVHLGQTLARRLFEVHGGSVEQAEGWQIAYLPLFE